MDEKWWDKSITLVEGCKPVSEGCQHCWSADMTHRFHQDKGLTTNGHFNGKIICREDRFKEILKRRKPTRWTIWNDLFHESVPDEFIWQVLEVSQKCYARFVGEGICNHILQLLTKRPKRMAECIDRWLKDYGYDGIAPYTKNLWLGVTAENQKCADERIPILLQIPAAVRFVSFEPLLEPIEFVDDRLFCERDLNEDSPVACVPCHCGRHWENGTLQGVRVGCLDWGIIGAESGPKRRLCNPDWIRNIINQCKAAGVPPFVKQIQLVQYKNRPVSHDMAEWPEDLRIREYP